MGISEESYKPHSEVTLCLSSASSGVCMSTAARGSVVEFMEQLLNVIRLEVGSWKTAFDCSANFKGDCSTNTKGLVTTASGEPPIFCASFVLRLSPFTPHLLLDKLSVEE